MATDLADFAVVARVVFRDRIYLWNAFGRCEKPCAGASRLVLSGKLVLRFRRVFGFLLVSVAISRLYAVCLIASVDSFLVVLRG